MIPSLNGLRAFSIILVILSHLLIVESFPGDIKILLRPFANGEIGVRIFFVISGFLITWLLLKERERTGKINLRKFYLRRLLRIFPVFYFYLFVVWLSGKILGNEVEPGILFVSTVYLQNFSFAGSHWLIAHSWSLAVEEHFYLFWPLVVYWLKPNKIKIAIVVLIVVAFLTRLILVKNDLETFYFTLSRMDELAVGALLAVLEIEGKLKPSNANKFIWLFLALMIPTIILWILATGQSLPAIQVSKYALLAFSYFSLIGFIISANQNHPILKPLNIFTYTGKISYGLYVYHPLCFFLINYYFKINSVLILFIISFGFSYLLATASFYLFENKFLKLKEKLTKKN